MNQQQFLKKIRDLNISMQLDEEGDLSIEAEEGVLTDTIIWAIKERKKEIVDYLRQIKGQQLDMQTIPKASPAALYPLSGFQHRLWVIYKLDRHSTAYNIQNSLPFHGQLDMSIFESAIGALVNRHETLRTIFREENGTGGQEILPFSGLTVRLGYTDLRNDDKQEGSAGLAIQLDKALPFVLEEWPLFRIKVYRMKDEEYLIYFNIHHIICDEWSMDLLYRDLFHFYHSLTAGVAPALPTLSIQYKDFSVWQQQQIAAGRYDQSRQYWLHRLSGELPVFDLPSYRCRPATKTSNGYGLSTWLGKEPVGGLRRLCNQHQCSLFMGLLTLLKALIYRTTGETDIIIGVPAADREHVDLEEQVGFYINTLALRSRVNGAGGLPELLSAVKESTLGGYAHQQYPFDRLVEELASKRDPGRSLVFDTWMVLQERDLDDDGKEITPGEEDGNDGTDITDIGEMPVKLDLHFSFSVMRGGLVMKVQFNRDVYDRESMARFIGHFKGLLRAAVADAGASIDELVYLSPEEQRALLDKPYHASVEFPEKETVICLWRQQVEKNAGKIALVFEGKTRQYGVLDEMSSRLSYHLIDRGTRKGGRVIIGMDDPPGGIIGILAILKAGASYVPLDPLLPKERIAHVVREIGPSVILCDIASRHRFEGGEYAMVVIDAEGAVVDGEPGTRWGLAAADLSAAAPDPESLLYIIYTSGSTGTPKGVMITHRNMLDYVYGLRQATAVGDCRSFGLVSGITTDLGNTVLYSALLGGGELHLFRKESTNNAFYMLDYFMRNSIDCLKIVPAHWNALSADARLLLPGRLLIFGGELLRADLVERIWRANPACTVVNHYGPTETTVGKLLHITHRENHYRSGVPIGLPFANTRVYILDARRNPVPRGVVGELYIGGTGLSKGYWKNDGLTAQVFVADRFCPGHLMYRTGDAVRTTADGGIEYLGRLDNQVKIRGYRIEIGEIEMALSRLPEVGSSVVVALDDAEGVKSLTAYIVPNPGGELKDIRDRLLEVLPDYMIPARLIRIERMPLTPNGKIDKSALPPPGSEEKGTDRSRRAPSNEMEEKLVKVFEGIFKRNDIGVNDNFFDLGGDSIKAILLASRLMQQGYSIRVSDIMHHPTIHLLALHVQATTHTASQVPVEGEVQLTPVQCRFLEGGLPDKNHYNQSILLRSNRPIREEALGACLAFLTAHHDALRVVLGQCDGVWRQLNRGTVAGQAGYGVHWRYEVHDLRMEEAPLDRMGLLADGLQESMDLSTGPLLKAGVFRMKDGDRLLLIIHHLVVDGVSWRILLEDLATLFKQYEVRKPLSLPSKTHSFKAWSDELYRFSGSEDMSKELPYWESIVEQAGPTSRERRGLLHKGGDVTPGSAERRSVRFAVNIPLTDIQAILLAALAKSMEVSFHMTQLLIEMEGHGREDRIKNVDVGRTVGWFTAIYPLILNLEDTPEAEKCLAMVRDALGRIPDKGIGFGVLRYLSPRGRDSLSRMRKPDVVFNYLGDFGTGGASANGEEEQFTYSHEYGGQNTSRKNKGSQGLSVSGVVVDGALQINIEFNTDEYSMEEGELLADSYKYHLLTFTGPIDGAEKSYGLSPLQEGIYFHWLMDPDSPEYTIQSSYVLEGQFDVEWLRRSYDYLHQRYDVLRTSFHHQQGTVTQVVRRSADPVFTFMDATRETEVSGQWIADIRNTDRQKPFDLEKEPQMRLTAIRWADGRWEFIWTYHHILMDGWCVNNLINDFFTIYRGLRDGMRPVLLPVVPYSNYVQWLSGLDHRDSFRYWEQLLGDIATVTEMPFKQDKKRANPAGILAAEVLELDAPLTTAIADICRRLRITENSFIQAAWARLLGFYHQSGDVVFGSVVSGRPAEIAGVERMVGLFSNTIPVRVSYQLTNTVADLLKSVQAQSIAGVPHHYMRLSDIQSVGANRGRLFDHILVCENYYREESVVEDVPEDRDTEGWTVLSAASEMAETNYDLIIHIFPGHPHFRIAFNYKVRAFTPEQVRRIRGHLLQVLHSFVESVDRSLSTVCCLTVSEREEILGWGRGKWEEYGVGRTVVDWWREAVSRHGEKVAVECGGSEWSYRELEERSNRLSRYLIRKGVRPGMLVGICVERSLDLVGSIWGVLKSGAGYVPLDPGYPAERIRGMMEDSGAGFIITQSCYKELLGELVTGRLYLDRDEIAVEMESGEGVRVEVGEELLAYVMYTSGSTGKPKGVMISHGQLYNYVSYSVGRYMCGEEEEWRVPLFTSMSFDLTVTSFFGSVLSGGRLVVYGQELGIGELVGSIFGVGSGINFVKCTPSHLELLRELGLDRTGVKRLVVGGEELKGHHLRLLEELNGGVVVYNEYGPTEATVGCIVEEWRGGEGIEELSIGRPISNMGVYILDGEGSLVPVGIDGELYVSGRQVSSGYLGREELTAERFREHGEPGGERLYRTGDRCQWMGDGRIRYRGRMDEQVKIRGYRVEPGEVERVLGGLPGVETAVVLARRGSDGQTGLIGFVVSVEEGEWREQLEGLLPAYMLPERIMRVEGLPVTSNGKIDRKELSKLAEGESGMPEYIAPRNETEEKLVRIWTRVLMKERVGVRNSFFDLGGHSIKAIMVMTQIHMEFNVKIGLEDVFNKPVLEDMAKEIARLVWVKAGADMIAAAPDANTSMII